MLSKLSKLTKAQVSLAKIKGEEIHLGNIGSIRYKTFYKHLVRTGLIYEVAHGKYKPTVTFDYSRRFKEKGTTLYTYNTAIKNKTTIFVDVDNQYRMYIFNP